MLFRSETDEEIFQKSCDALNDAVDLSVQICSELQDSGVPSGLATMAMGIGYAAGAFSVGMPLAIALDLVRNIYAQNQDKSKAH